MLMTEASTCLSKGSASSWGMRQVRYPTVEDRGTQQALEEPKKQSLVLRKSRGDRGGGTRLYCVSSVYLDSPILSRLILTMVL